ncbi:hypothetical protein LCGC14_2823700 [marine sediment metagenome]|uniref:Uncharacterized protein n=1 Tax=marine sediment metagenome TaxID=412755 RepID=A0A0F8YGA7_9ZZZZ
MSSKIGGKEALMELAQVYRTQVWEFSSILIAISVGLVVIPVFTLNISLTGGEGLTLELRLLFLAITVFLADVGIYCITQSIIADMIHREIMSRLKTKEKSLLEYLTDIKTKLRSKFPVMQHYRMPNLTQKKALHRLYKLQIWGSVIVSLIIPMILFSFIWWNYDPFFDLILASELLYLVSAWIVYRYVTLV